MSGRISRCTPLRSAGPSCQQTKMVLDVDLNAPPSDQPHFGEVEASINAPILLEMQSGQQRSQPPPVTIDVDTIDDDDVVLSSPMAFAQARNSRRYRSRSDVVHVELESAIRDALSRKRQRVPANQPVINCESYEERSGSDVNGYGRNMAFQTRKFMVAAAPPPPPPPPEAAFSCPICMGPFVEEMSTKCGHIFCKDCIKKAIAAQGKCPTCRKKTTMRGTIRIYLPKTS